MVNHNINAQDNNLAEIQQTALEAAAKVQCVEMQERQVCAQEKKQLSETSIADSGEVLSKIKKCGTALGEGSNRFKIGSDIACAKLGMPSVELAGMALEVLGDRGGIFKSVKDSMSDKSLGYNVGKKEKTCGVKTKHFNDIAGRASCVADFTKSGVKGVKASKSSAINCKHIKDLVIGQRMACEKTYNAAKRAEMQLPAIGGKGANARKLMATMAPKGYVDPETLKRKAADNNIWGDGDGTTTL